MDGWATQVAAGTVVPKAVAMLEDAPEAPLNARCSETEMPPKRRLRALGIVWQWAPPLLLCGMLIALLILSALNSDKLLGFVVRGLDWLRSLGHLAPLVLLGLQIGAMLFVMPTWPLWLCGGAAFTTLWGQLAGLGIAFATLGIGVWLGSILAFLLGRSLLRPCVADCASRRPLMRAIDLAVETRGLELGLLLKLSPLMHTSASNYLLAATRMRFVHFALACPGTFLSMSVWIFAGASLSSLAALRADPSSAAAAAGGTPALEAALSPRMRAVMVRGCTPALRHPPPCPFRQSAARTGAGAELIGHGGPARRGRCTSLGCTALSLLTLSPVPRNPLLALRCARHCATARQMPGQNTPRYCRAL